MDDGIDKRPSYLCIDESQQQLMSDCVQSVVTSGVHHEETTNRVAVERTERIQQTAVRWHVDHRLTTTQ